MSPLLSSSFDAVLKCSTARNWVSVVAPVAGSMAMVKASAPVVVATRFSLSFPLLISAVPLWTVDWTLVVNQDAWDAWKVWKRQGGTGPKPQRRLQAERCWFSDGGIASNTPLDYVLGEENNRDLLIFQVDLFSARGDLPTSLLEAAEREEQNARVLERG